MTALTRINEITTLNEKDRKQVYMVVDALIRDHKAKHGKKLSPALQAGLGS